MILKSLDWSDFFFDSTNTVARESCLVQHSIHQSLNLKLMKLQCRVADPAIHKSQLADPSSTHPVHDDEDVDEADVEVAYVTGDSELTYVSGKTGGASKTDEAGQIPRNDL